MDTRHITFNDLPDDMLVEIWSFLSITDKSRFARLCKQFFYIGIPESLRVPYKNEFISRTNWGVDKILYFLAWEPDIYKMEDYIKKDFGLLLEFRTFFHFGYRYEGTPLMIALGLENMRYVNTIISYLWRLPNGKDEIARQVKMQFPVGWKEKQAEREEKDIHELRKLTDIFLKNQIDFFEKPNNEIKAAMEQFFTYLEQQEKIFRWKRKAGIGKYYNNTRLLCEALKIYADHYETNFGEMFYSIKLKVEALMTFPSKFLEAWASILQQKSDQPDIHYDQSRNVLFRKVIRRIEEPNEFRVKLRTISCREFSGWTKTDFQMDIEIFKNIKHFSFFYKGIIDDQNKNLEDLIEKYNPS